MADSSDDADAASVVPDYVLDHGNGLPPTPDDTAEDDFEESMVGGPEMDDLLAAAATRRQDGGGQGADARRGCGLGSAGPMGAAAEATAAQQQAQQQQHARSAEAARVIDEVSRRVLGVPYEQLTNEGTPARAENTGGDYFLPRNMENNLSHGGIAQPPQPVERGAGAINMEDSFECVGTDFLLAAAAELERRATLVQQGGGTPVQGGRTPQRSRAGSVADQIEDQNYESYGQGPFAQGPLHTGPRPDHVSTATTGRQWPP